MKNKTKPALSLNQVLINNTVIYLIKLQCDMRQAAFKLKALGFKDKAKEMTGAANILQTWIEGIKEDAGLTDDR